MMGKENVYNILRSMEKYNILRNDNIFLATLEKEFGHTVRRGFERIRKESLSYLNKIYLLSQTIKDTYIGLAVNGKIK